ncbi:MAG TPA: DNA replication and repair protein RecF [Polyangiaceae bacterium]
MIFQRVALRGFRNLGADAFNPAGGVNLLFGDNGQGKTSLLEALYFVATSRSFRTERLSELLQHGEEVCSVQATIQEEPLLREQRAVLQARVHSVSIDGRKPESLAAYATRTPVVAFHPADLELVSGSAVPRRKLLDRLALYLEPVSIDDRRRYLRALRARQRVLELRGDAAQELDAFEQVMAEHGARWARARAAAVEALNLAVQPLFQRLSAGGELTLGYRPGGVQSPETFLQKLERQRRADLRRRLATFGPQRDELELRVGGQSARHHASQGQQRIVALALKLAELECVRRAREVEPVLLLDDVSSELDTKRGAAVHELVARGRNQVFLTTTHPEFFKAKIEGDFERADWAVRGGRLERAGPV